MSAKREDADLLLRLYEMRREPKLREARAYFMGKFCAQTLDELNAVLQNAETSALFRQSVTYWAMVASLVNRGLLDDELFFENTGELPYFWEKLKAVVPAQREAMKNPMLYANIEKLAAAYFTWVEKHAPGAAAAFQARVADGVAKLRAAR